MLLLFDKTVHCHEFGLVAKPNGAIVLRAIVLNGKFERLAISIEYKITTSDASNTRKRDFPKRNTKKLLGCRFANAFG